VIAVQSQTPHHASTPAMAAAAVALSSPEGPGFIKTMVTAFDERRKFFIPALNRIPGIACPDPAGAFYAFPDVSALYRNAIHGSMDLVNHLLQVCGVAAVPGIAFGDDRCIRFSFAVSLDKLQTAISRLKKGLSQ
jgi:aspartate aminotransferase